MPSPFPGMDPYLEGELWTTLHSQLGAEIARQLAPKLRPKYLAFTTERQVLEEPDSVAITTASVYPDIGVIKIPGREAANVTASTAEPPLRLATVMPTPVPHVSVEIRDVKHRKLVTAIELLSPTNKRGKGRRQYLARRRRLLLSTAHLLEIDLLHQGQRVPMQAPLPSAPYFVLLSRFEDRPLSEVWPIRLDESLPTVPVPLRDGDPDVPLDLQQAFTSVYDVIGYDLAVDYTEEPPVAMPDDEARWADHCLRAAGLRR